MKGWNIFRMKSNVVPQLSPRRRLITTTVLVLVVILAANASWEAIRSMLVPDECPGDFVFDRVAMSRSSSDDITKQSGSNGNTAMINADEIGLRRESSEAAETNNRKTDGVFLPSSSYPVYTCFTQSKLDDVAVSLNNPGTSAGFGVVTQTPPPPRPSAVMKRKTEVVQGFPNVLFQTGHSRLLPPGIIRASKSLLAGLPGGFQYRFFSDEEARLYVLQHCDRHVPNLLKAFDMLIPGAYRADLFRYCHLYHEGGVYIDLGFNRLIDLHKPLLRLSELLREARCEGVSVIAVEDNGLGFLYNAFMASMPKHPLFLISLQLATERVLAKLYARTNHGGLLPTGPQLFRDAALSYTTGVNVSVPVVMSNPEFSVRRMRPGRHKDLSVVRYRRGLSCMSGTVEVQAGDLGSNSTVHGVVMYTKTADYYYEFQRYSGKEHYSRLWDRGPQHVYL